MTTKYTLHSHNSRLTYRQHHTTSIFTTKITVTTLIFTHRPLVTSSLQREDTDSISKHHTGALLPETVGVWGQKADDQQVVGVGEHEARFWAGSSLFLPFLKKTKVPTSGRFWSLCFSTHSLSSCATFDIKFKNYTWLRNSSATLYFCVEYRWEESKDLWQGP